MMRMTRPIVNCEGWPRRLSYCLDALCNAFSRVWVSAGIFSLAYANPSLVNWPIRSSTKATKPGDLTQCQAM